MERKTLHHMIIPHSFMGSSQPFSVNGTKCYLDAIAIHVCWGNLESYSFFPSFPAEGASNCFVNEWEIKEISITKEQLELFKPVLHKFNIIT